MKNRSLILAVILALFVPLELSACSGAPPVTTTTAMADATTLTATAAPTTGFSNGEVEATEFEGVKLTPISEQLNNGVAGKQVLDRATYTLTVDGMVDHPLTLSYDDLLAYPQIDRLLDLICVDGWFFTAKWTGPSLKTIFADAGVNPEATIVIFYTTDAPSGFSSLDLKYIMENDTIIALKDNDITLPPERGFPFQVVAASYGYKWAKWVTRIEISDHADYPGLR